MRIRHLLWVSRFWASQSFGQSAMVLEGEQGDIDAIFAVFAEWGRAFRQSDQPTRSDANA